MHILGHFVTILNLLWVVVGIIRWGNLGSGMRGVVLFLAYSLVSTHMTFMMGQRAINNLWVLHIYTLVSCTALLLVFAYWETQRVIRRWMFAAAVMFAIGWGVSKVTLEVFTGFDNFTMPLAAALLVSAAVRTLYTVLVFAEYPVVRDARFWVSVAVIIESCATVLSISAGNVMLRNRSGFLTLIEFQWVAGIVYMLCYGRALFCRHTH